MLTRTTWIMTALLAGAYAAWLLLLPALQSGAEESSARLVIDDVDLFDGERARGPVRIVVEDGRI
ncbi:MAG: hypothetical protein AAFX85_19115, partial [Pseudomonadota bacterium]